MRIFVRCLFGRSPSHFLGPWHCLVPLPPLGLGRIVTARGALRALHALHGLQLSRHGTTWKTPLGPAPVSPPEVTPEVTTRGIVCNEAIEVIQAQGGAKRRILAQFGTWTLLVATMSQLRRKICRNYVRLVLELHFLQKFFRPRKKQETLAGKHDEACHVWLKHCLHCPWIHPSLGRWIYHTKGLDTIDTMCSGAAGFTTEIATQGNTNAPATHHWNSDLRDLAVNFLVHFAMRLDRQISTLENCHLNLNYVSFFTYFDVGGSILQVRVSCGDRSPVEFAKARIFCARRKREKPKMPSVPFLHDVWMLLCSFLAYAKHHGHSPAKAESKKKITTK